MNKYNPCSFINDDWFHINEKKASLKICDSLLKYDYSVLFGLCRTGKSRTSIVGQLLASDQFFKRESRSTLLVNMYCGSAIAVKEENAGKYETVLEENFADDSDYNCLNDSLVDNDLVIDAKNNKCALQYLNIHRNDIDQEKPNSIQIRELINLWVESGDLVIFSLDECDISHNSDGNLVAFCDSIGIDLRNFSTNLPNLKCIEISATMSESIDRLQSKEKMDLLSYLEREDTFITFAKLQAEERIKKCPSLTHVNPLSEERELTTEAKEIFDSIPFSKASIIHPKWPKESFKLIREYLLSKGWRVKTVTSGENRNGQDLIKLVNRYDAKKDDRPLICLVKHAYGRGLEVDREKLGYVISEISSTNESTDYQRHSRQTGYFDIDSTDFIMFVPELEKIARWIAYEEDVTEKLRDYKHWYDPCLLLSSTHSSGNIRRSPNSHKVTYGLLSSNETIQEYRREHNLTLECPRRNVSHDIYKHIILEQVKGSIVEGQSRGRVRLINEGLSVDNPPEHRAHFNEWTSMLSDKNNPRVQKIMKSCALETYEEFKTHYSANKIVQIIEIEAGVTSYSPTGRITSKESSLNYEGSEQ